MQNFLTHILSGHSFVIYCYFHNQNISFIEQGTWRKKLHFCSMGLKGTPLCACCFVPVFQFNSIQFNTGFIRIMSANQRLNCTGLQFTIMVNTYIQCHALKRHRPIDKKCIFFLLHLISLVP